MRDCVERGKSGGQSMGKLVGDEAKLLNEAFRRGKTFLDPLTVKAELYALSVMGENSRMGVIVAAPTAGAGGVVPGMLLALEEERHIDPEKTVRALVVAGGIGSIIALSANISGAAGGCQNEVGVAASMGAAAVAYMMGGNTRTPFTPPRSRSRTRSAWSAIRWADWWKCRASSATRSSPCTA